MRQVNKIRKLFAPIFKRWCKMTIKRAVNEALLGSDIWVWFPNICRCFKMRISSMKSKTLTARFIKNSDHDAAFVEEDFGQTDNDIVISTETAEPVKKN